MATRRVVRRILISIAATALGLLLLIALSIQIGQHILRHRAERLLVDFQSIRLHQSTWADAQVLMNRWGTWGHYEGQCTTVDCKYTIRLFDIGTRMFDPPANSWWQESLDVPNWRQRAWRFFLYRLYLFIGGRICHFGGSFIVQDGTIWRDAVYFGISAPIPTREKSLYKDEVPPIEEQNWYDLEISARASDVLSPTKKFPWVMGDNDQLAQHPFYKSGRPDGCENCMHVEVAFTPYISQDDVRRLTSYDLSCLTRVFNLCRLPADMLPAIRDQHFYEENRPPDPPSSPTCEVPEFARGRDASTVLSVDVLSVQEKKEYLKGDVKSEMDTETAKVRIGAILKGTSLWAPGSVVEAQPQAFNFNNPTEAAEQMVQGKRYILLPEYRWSNASSLIMLRCDVLTDTPQIRAELQKGFAQNDDFRHTEELTPSPW